MHVPHAVYDVGKTRMNRVEAQVVAAALGPSVGFVVGTACVIGAGVAVVALLRRRVHFGETLPFAPFIALATMASVSAGVVMK